MTASPSPPPYPGAERRRRQRGAWSRLLTAPIPVPRLPRPGPRVTRWVLGTLAAAVLGMAGWQAWAHRLPLLAPRHRAEAVCFALAAARYAPPLAVEPSAAIVRGRFSEQTPAGIAVRDAMGFTDDMVLYEDTRRVGDFEVAVLWLQLPAQPGHWLVLAWMEDADLGVCSFRFPGDSSDLLPEERVWGERLLVLALRPENFRAGALPDVRLRGEPPRSFGAGPGS